MGLVGGVRACWSCESCACRLVFVSSHATAELYIYISSQEGLTSSPPNHMIYLQIMITEYKLSCSDSFIQCISPPRPSPSTWTVLARRGS